MTDKGLNRMADVAHGCRLGELLAADGIFARHVAAERDVLDRVVTRSVLVNAAAVPAAVDDNILLVYTPPASLDAASYLSELSRIGASPGSRMIAIWPPAEVDDRQLVDAANAHVLLVAAAPLDPAGLISAVARAVQPADQALTGRLTALQRALTRALAEPQPLPALVTRLAKTCNATAAVVRADGQQEAASGPIPQALLLGQLGDGPGDSRPFAIQGWNGIGVRITDESGPAGWLLMTSRRHSFPDPHAIAAAHVAASLVETHLRIDMLARRQDRAMRSLLLNSCWRCARNGTISSSRVGSPCSGCPSRGSTGC